MLYDKGTAHTSRTGNKIKVQILTQVFFLITQVKKGSRDIKHIPKINSYSKCGSKKKIVRSTFETKQ